MKGAYLKSTFRDIFKAPGRMLSIILIIMMGVLLFVGIKAVGPNLENTMDSYYRKYNLSDVQVTALNGFSEEDKNKLKNIQGANVEFGYSIPFADEETGNTIQLISYNNNGKHNRLHVVEGKAPAEDDEIAIDNRLKEDYSLNSYVKINSPALKEDKFRVVGYVNSPSFIANSERGPSSIGGGRLDGFFVVPKSAFALPNFSTATISFSSLTNKKTTSQEYKDEIKNKINEIENVLDDNNFIVNNQTSDPGYGDYEGLSSRIDLIGNVFPVFFFFIAGLITFTAMVRFVEENRQEIGTLKSLGYKNREIFRKYVIFSLFVAAVGLLGGILIGTYLLPLAVFSMLEGQYIFTNYTTSFYVWPIVISVAATIIVTLGASIISLWGTLKEKPTSLLAMKAPKMGKSVFLERFPALWSKLNFNQKITYRNITRYKSRMVLTVLGIAGCTGLMLAGFGLRDSIGETASYETTNVVKYQAIVSLNKNINSTGREEVQNKLKNNSEISIEPVFMNQLTTESDDVALQTVTFFATNNVKDFSAFFNMRTTDEKNIYPTDNGVVIGQKLASLYNINPGDKISVKDVNGEKYDLKISGIMNNYMGHYIIATKNYAQKIMNQELLQNAYLVKIPNSSVMAEKKFAEDLISTGNVSSVSLTSSQIEKQDRMTQSFSPVVLIFIILSGVLAFVVLYNLTAINILERQRELSTLRVLGFYNSEVTMYIVRENVIFTIIGILLGYVIGNVLTWFILVVASSDQLSFPFVIHWQGYLIATLGTIFFTAIVSFSTHIKLRNVDMIKALKSSD